MIKTKSLLIVFSILAVVLLTSAKSLDTKNSDYRCDVNKALDLEMKGADEKQIAKVCSELVKGVKSRLDFEFCDTIPGDVNDDYLINVADIVQLVPTILNQQYEVCGDVNFDMTVNIADIVQMVEYILGSDSYAPEIRVNWTEMEFGYNVSVLVFDMAGLSSITGEFSGPNNTENFSADIEGAYYYNIPLISEDSYGQYSLSISAEDINENTAVYDEGLYLEPPGEFIVGAIEEINYYDIDGNCYYNLDDNNDPFNYGEITLEVLDASGNVIDGATLEEFCYGESGQSWLWEYVCGDDGSAAYQVLGNCTAGCFEGACLI